MEIDEIVNNEIVNQKWYGKELKTRALNIITSNLGVLGTSFLFKDGVIQNPIAATAFGLADACFLVNDYLHIMTDNSLNAKTNGFKVISELLTTLPSLVLIPTAVTLFNTPFPTDKYILYHVATPFIGATALGGLSTVIDKSTKIYDYCKNRNADRNGYTAISDSEFVSEDNNTTCRVVLSNMTKTMTDLSILGVTVGLTSIYTMLEEQNAKNPDNPDNTSLIGFYLLAAPVIYNTLKATASLVSSSYRGAKTILAKTSSWCTSKNEEMAALINSLHESENIQQDQNTLSRSYSIY